MKSMKLHKSLVAIIIGVCSVPQFCFADIRITEIMYDVPGTDTGREWVEIINDSGEEVSLEGITLFENNVQHKIDISSNGTLLAGEYGVIADNKEKFLIDYPSFTGKVFDSVFSLVNTGESLAIYKNGTLLQETTYDVSLGGVGDGNTIQWNGSSFVIGGATPGTGFDASIVITKEQNEESTEEKALTSANTTTSTHSSAEALTTLPELKVKTDAGRERYVTTNSPVLFSGRLQVNGKEVKNGKYNWTFGDGFNGVGREVNHIFLFPGEYNVVLNSVIEGTKAVSRTKVIVTDPKVIISHVSYDEGFVEVKNSSTKEVNIGNWQLIAESGSERKKHVFPEDTILNAGMTIKFPSAFKTYESASIKLLYPNGKEVTTYALPSMVTIEEVSHAVELLSQEIRKLML